MNLTQPQIALLIGFCLSLACNSRSTSRSGWNGMNLAVFKTGKQLASTTEQKQGVRHD
jgi:hypothetical protein